MQGVIHAGFMYHACITQCHTSDWDFSNIYMIFLLSMYLNYKGLVWYDSGHPGVPFSDIRVWRVVTSGCRKPEDGGVSEHFCLFSALFLLVFSKKSILCWRNNLLANVYWHVSFRVWNNTGYLFQCQGEWYKCDIGVIHGSGMYHSCSYCLSMLTKQNVIEW